MPSLVYRRNDVWGTSLETLCWWRVTTPIWVALLVCRKVTSSSVYNFCALSPDVNSRGNQWYRHELMSAVFSAKRIISNTSIVFFFVFFFLFCVILATSTVLDVLLWRPDGVTDVRTGRWVQQGQKEEKEVQGKAARPVKRSKKFAR